MAVKREKTPYTVQSGTIIDYVAWRGDLTFEHSRWGEIDSVIAAMIAYANLGENELAFGSGRDLRLGSLAESDLLTRLPQQGLGNSVEVRNQFLTDLALSRRFQDITVLDQVNDVDEGRDIQFSATTMDVPGVGIVVAFRGTDPSPVGWKEDFMMSYVTPVPAQSAAIRYLQKAAENTEGPMYLTGHSKGGNLALYSAAHTDPAIQARLKAVYSFDGPGLDDETIVSEGYQRIEERVRSVVPSGSIVGMLMNYHPKYRVVQSDAKSILQHDPFSWKLIGRRFVEEDGVTSSSQILDRTVHEWLKCCTAEQREVFVTTIFSMLARRADPDAARNPAEEMGLLKKTDDSARQMILSLINKLITIHARISWETNILKPTLLVSEELRQRLKALQGNLEKSDVITLDNQGHGFDAAVEETLRAGAAGGLDHKECLRLALLAEEMLSMVSMVGRDMKATFWVEHINRQYELQLATSVLMDKRRRRQLKDALAARKDKKPNGFLARLREDFERAMVSDSDQITFALPEEKDRLAAEEWDGYERSILYRIADDVWIGIYGNAVRMTVRKEFK